MRRRSRDESSESASLLRLALSLGAAAFVLTALILVVSGAPWSEERGREAPVGASSSPAGASTVNFVLPPLPPPDVTTYYLVATEADAEAVRSQAEANLVARRRAGLPLTRMVAVVADATKAEGDYEAELIRGAPPLLKDGFSVRYEVVDLRR